MKSANNTIFIFILFLGIVLSSMRLFSQESRNTGINLFLYANEEDESGHFTRVMPFYSYKTSPDRLQEEFFFWPLLAGYEISKNPIPSVLPHGLNFQWNAFQFLTLGGNSIDPTQRQEVSTMVSFLFMTYFRENYVTSEYFSKSWYSLPLLSFYQNETLIKKNIQIGRTNLGNPIFSFTDINIIYKDQFFPSYQWSINPASLVLGDEMFKVIYQARWGRDYIFEICGLSPFSLFSISTSFSSYPGSEYDLFSKFEVDTNKGLEKLFSSKLASPRTRLGILSPLILFETDPSGFFSWQFLPLFSYSSDKEEYRFNILLTGIEFSSQGLQFHYEPKIFPLVYYDSLYGTWDILWPMFRYAKNPVIPGFHITFRFVFDYQETYNIQGHKFVDMAIVEGLLASYQSQQTSKQLEILPSGLLFGYYESPSEYQWRFLGFGYQETSQKKSLQVFFIKIPIEYKNLVR